MGKHRKDNTYYSNKELEQKTLRAIRVHIKNELYKMAQLTVELSKSPEIPIEWRKKGDKKTFFKTTKITFLRLFTKKSPTSGKVSDYVGLKVGMCRTSVRRSELMTINKL